MNMHKSELNLRLLTPFEREVILLLQAIKEQLDDIAQRREG
jgi:hypothetical protein